MHFKKKDEWGNVYIHNECYSAMWRDWAPVICSQMGGTRGYHGKWNKLGTD